MRRLLPLVLAAILLAGADAPPPAAPSPPPAAPATADSPSVTDEKLAAAHELLTAMNTQANSLEMFKALRGVLVQNIQARSGKPEPEVAGVVDDILMPEISSRLGEFVDALAQVQASVYSVDEMHQLTAFYETPLGKRVVEVTPKLGALSFAAGQEWGRRVALDALQKHADELRERGLKL